jgi:hypothetical protein
MEPSQFEEQVTAELGLVTAEEGDHLQRRIEVAINAGNSPIRPLVESSLHADEVV